MWCQDCLKRVGQTHLVTCAVKWPVSETLSSESLLHPQVLLEKQPFPASSFVWAGFLYAWRNISQYDSCIFKNVHSTKVFLRFPQESHNCEWHPCLIPSAAVKFSRTVCFCSNMGQMCKTEGKIQLIINDAAELQPCSLSHLNILLSILGTCVADSVPFQIQPATFSMSYYKSEVL